jgi:hypothetical protein
VGPLLVAPVSYAAIRGANLGARGMKNVANMAGGMQSVASYFSLANPLVRSFRNSKRPTGLEKLTETKISRSRPKTSPTSSPPKDPRILDLAGMMGTVSEVDSGEYSGDEDAVVQVLCPEFMIDNPLKFGRAR